MISIFKWQQIKALSAKGMKIKGIANKLGVSKNTVRMYAIMVNRDAYPMPKNLTKKIGVVLFTTHIIKTAMIYDHVLNRGGKGCLIRQTSLKTGLYIPKIAVFVRLFRPYNIC